MVYIPTIRREHIHIILIVIIFSNRVSQGPENIFRDFRKKNGILPIQVRYGAYPNTASVLVGHTDGCISLFEDSPVRFRYLIAL